MANVIIDDTNLTNIAAAIREKNGETTTYKPSEMADAIAAISTGGSTDGTALITRTITEVVDETITTVGAYAFSNCSALTTLDLPNCTRLNEGSVSHTTKLENINLPKVQYVFNYVFQGAGTSNTILELPEVTNISDYVFNAAWFNTVKLPKVTLINTRCFYNFYGQVVDVGESCASIGAYAFRDAYPLKTLILRKSDAIVTIQNTAVFTGSGVANGTGYVYVPSALVDTYKADSYWSSFANQIRAIEDYPDICG